MVGEKNRLWAHAVSDMFLCLAGYSSEVSWQTLLSIIKLCFVITDTMMEIKLYFRGKMCTQYEGFAGVRLHV